MAASTHRYKICKALKKEVRKAHGFQKQKAVRRLKYETYHPRSLYVQCVVVLHAPASIGFLSFSMSLP
jgi:hypothetical protein